MILDPLPPKRNRHFLDGSVVLACVGVVLFAAWLFWISTSLSREPLPRGGPHSESLSIRLSYIPFMPFMGIDYHHNYIAARTWLAGGDPYTAMRGDPLFSKYTYPPLTLLAFSWVAKFPPDETFWVTQTNAPTSAKAEYTPSRTALVTWSVIAVLILVLAAWKSWAIRASLPTSALPLPFVIAATLVSYPVLFELERGNCNSFPLLAVLVVTLACGWRNRMYGDLIVGLSVAIAVGIKPYAVILLVALVALRRPRAALFGAVGLGVQVLVFWPEFLRWLVIARMQNNTTTPVIADYSHSLIAHWEVIAQQIDWPWLMQLPPTLFVVLAVGVPVWIVSVRVYRSSIVGGIVWPYLLWLAAMATFVSPIANDYNLLFVPLALLAVWNSSDAWPYQVLAGAIAFWCQPIFTGISGLPWLLTKMLTVVALGTLVIKRLNRNISRSAEMFAPSEPTSSGPTATKSLRQSRTEISGHGRSDS